LAQFAAHINPPTLLAFWRKELSRTRIIVSLNEKVAVTVLLAFAELYISPTKGNQFTFGSPVRKAVRKKA